MKKFIIIAVVFTVAGFIAASDSFLQPKLQLHKTESQKNNSGTNNPHNLSPELKKALNCKSCHSCEYPTPGNPCLLNCPRGNLVSVYHSPKEGPEVVLINEMSENYGGVVFSHRLHAEMSEMTSGCEVCHHYNTTGPILNCRGCHENKRMRENVAIPDLKAAYHRQCLTCHKQWSYENGCNTQCHLQKGSDIDARRKEAVEKIKGRSHPLLPEPTKMIWETNYEEGKIVTFFHDEHFQVFKIKCNSCHKNDNCIKCHEKKENVDFTKPVKIKKTFDDHHMPCVNCHDGNSCKKCHRTGEMTPFNHGKSTGWALSNFHSRLSCAQCHGNNMPYKPLDRNCTSCHKDFVKGSFNHSRAGLILSEIHLEAECENCHINKDFSNAPQCASCHDDKSFPKNLPGKRNR